MFLKSITFYTFKRGNVKSQFTYMYTVCLYETFKPWQTLKKDYHYIFLIRNYIMEFQIPVPDRQDRSKDNFIFMRIKIRED